MNKKIKKRASRSWTQKLNKKGSEKISSELAIGIIILISLAVGAIFLLYGKQSGKMISKNQPPAKEIGQTANSKIAQNKDEDPCKSHYYSGESEVRGWIVSDKQEGKGIVVQISNEDVKKLPIKNAAVSSDNFTVRLVDPTLAVKKSLSQASKNNPANFTIRGYAEICHTEPPQISLEEATVAFKKT